MVILADRTQAPCQSDHSIPGTHPVVQFLNINVSSPAPSKSQDDHKQAGPAVMTLARLPRARMCDGRDVMGTLCLLAKSLLRLLAP